MTRADRQTSRYRIHRNGAEKAPWLVLVHGVSQDHRLFDRQVEAFRSDFNLILIDLPGHGLSSDLPGPYTPEAFSNAISASLDQAAIEHCHLWGTHLGATALLLSALANPGRVQSLVLEAPVVPGLALPSVSRLLKRIRRLVIREGMSAARNLWWHEGAWFDQIRADPIARRAQAQWAMIEDFQGAPWVSTALVPSATEFEMGALAALNCPCLIINGAQDLADFLEAATFLATTLSDARRVRIADCGGFPLWERPLETNSLVRDFLLPLALSS